MKAMKARFLLMGGMISALGLGLMIARGFQQAYGGLLGVGLILLLLGALWK